MNDKVTVLASLARALTRQNLEFPLAQRLASAACVVVGADGAAITLSYTRDERITLCATSDTAARIEDLQEVLGQGPGAIAYDSGEQVLAQFETVSNGTSAPGHRLADDGNELATAQLTSPAAQSRQWPELYQQVTDGFGPLSLLAVPIRPQSEVVGVLTFYGRLRNLDPLRQPDVGLVVDSEVAQFLADAVGVALLHDARSHVNEKVGPWAGRSQVHQATGMVIAQLRVPSADALALLRAHAFAQGLSLLDVCAAVLSREIDFSIEPWSDAGGREPYGDPPAEGSASAAPFDPSDGSTTA